MRLIDRWIIAVIRWRLARRRPGDASDYFSASLVHLVVMQLGGYQRDARVSEEAVHEIDRRLTALSKFDRLSEEEVRFTC